MDTDKRTIVFILFLELNNMALNEALYETEMNIINQIKIVLLSVLSVFIGGNLEMFFLIVQHWSMFGELSVNFAEPSVIIQGDINYEQRI
ncbi:MAG: hypothetical protein KBA66_23005 [Leptospiraceae bacterium]|nr:hypothetical protein [Leptospiraceae bacterium]